MSTSKKLASLAIKITADGAQAQKELKTLEQNVSDFGKSMQKLGSNLTKYVTVPLTALAGLSVKVANTQLQAEARLLTALKNRGDAQQRLINQAAEIQKRTTYGDEAIIEQQAYLAALDLTEEQITATIEAAVQLAAALGIELESATRNLAKTYSGLAGELGESIPALRELTAEQLKAGEAINYVNREYKGFAETAAATGAGKLQQLKNRIGDLAEKLGTALMPLLEKLVDWIAKLVDWFEQLSPATQESIAKWVALAAAAGPLYTIFGSLLTIIPKIGAALTALKGPLGIAAAGIFALMEKIDYAKHLQNQITASARSVGRIGADVFREMTTSAREHQQEGYLATRGMSYEEALQHVKNLALEAERTVDEDKKRRLSNMAEGASKAFQEIMAARVKEAEAADKLLESYGLIGKLQQDIAQLQDKMPFLQTAEEIATANDELAKLNEQLQYYTSLTNKVAEQSQIVKESTIATTPIDFGEGVSVKAGVLADTTTKDLQKWWDDLSGETDRIAELSASIANSLSQSFTSVAAAIGEGLASLITGEDFSPLQKVLSVLGELLTSLGAAMITYSAALEAFKVAIKSMNPWAALGAGLGLIAAGALVTAIANKPIKLANGGLAYGPTMAVVGDNPGASNDPEVIAPLSKLRDYMGGQKLQLMGDVSFEIHGDTLQAVLNRNNMRLATLG